MHEPRAKTLFLTININFYLGLTPNMRELDFIVEGFRSLEC